MGSIKNSIMVIIAGVITFVVGLSLASTVLSQAATAGSAATIGSFSGAQSLNDLTPLLYYAIIIFLGVSMMAVGGAGVSGKGPMSKR